MYTSHSCGNYNRYNTQCSSTEIKGKHNIKQSVSLLLWALLYFLSLFIIPSLPLSLSHLHMFLLSFSLFVTDWIFYPTIIKSVAISVLIMIKAIFLASLNQVWLTGYKNVDFHCCLQRLILSFRILVVAREKSLFCKINVFTSSEIVRVLYWT